MVLQKISNTITKTVEEVFSLKISYYFKIRIYS